MLSCQELEEHGPSPDAAVYNVLLMAEESAEGVREVVQRMRRQGVAPNERTYRWVGGAHVASMRLRTQEEREKLLCSVRLFSIP